MDLYFNQRAADEQSKAFKERQRRALLPQSSLQQPFQQFGQDTGIGLGGKGGAIGNRQMPQFQGINAAPGMMGGMQQSQDPYISAIKRRKSMMQTNASPMAGAFGGLK